MSVLKKSKKHLTIIGIRIVPKQNLPEFLQDFQLAFNRIQILCVIFLFGTFSISVFCTLIFKANGFSELSEALTYCVIGIVHSSFYYISVWKRPNIMTFMDDLEETIEKSWFKNHFFLFKFSSFLKSFNFYNKIKFHIGSENRRTRVIYKQSNEMADKFSNFIWKSMFVYSSLYIIPATFVSYYNYFTLDEMDQAFQLPMPSMSVIF